MRDGRRVMGGATGLVGVIGGAEAARSVDTSLALARETVRQWQAIQRKER